MSQTTIEMMRADWRQLQRHADSVGLTSACIREIGDAIADAVKSGDAERIEGWAADLRDRLGQLDALAGSCRAAEQRMREHCAAERKANGEGGR